MPETSLKQPASNFAAILDRADEHHKAWRYWEAEPLYISVLEAEPGHPRANHNLGLLRLKADGPTDGLAFLRRALRNSPGNPGYWRAYARCLLLAGKPRRAKKVLQQAERKGIEVPNAKPLIARIEQAIAKGGDTLSDRDGNIPAGTGKSQLAHLVGLFKSKRFDAAERQVRALLKDNPNFQQGWNVLGLILGEREQLEEASDCFRKALELQSDSAEVHSNFANILAKLGALDEAEKSFERSISLNAKLPGVYLNYGTFKRQQGKFDEAHEYYLRALKIDPDNGRVFSSLVSNKASVPEDSIVSHMQTLARSNSTPRQNRQSIFNALGHLSDRQGNYEEAFENWQASSRIARQGVNYDIEHERKVFESLKTRFSKRFFEHLPDGGCASAQPIFILGMPRSGSTLVEQILSSHGDVDGAGELPHLRLETMALRNEFGVDTTGDGFVPEDKRRESGERYLRGMQSKIGTESPRITDKMPQNFLFIWLIRMILPNAVIIHTRRDPRDTCLSIFSNHFSGHHPYAYDLKELGYYYRFYVDLMRHWDHVQPGLIYTVDYEKLVDDLEGETRKLLDHCGLPFDQNCLDFHKSDRMVQTVSAMQVREKIHNKSIGRWRNYETQLAPLIDIVMGAPKQ